MMTGIAQDFVKYVMHVQVVQNQQAAGRQAPAVQNLQTSSSDDDELGGFDRAAACRRRRGRAAAGGRCRRRRPRSSRPIVKDDFSKTPRNAPCPCGSGKKFKQCHGAT